MIWSLWLPSSPPCWWCLPYPSYLKSKYSPGSTLRPLLFFIFLQSTIPLRNKGSTEGGDRLMTSANTWLRVSTANIMAKGMNGFYLCCAYDQCCGKESIACPSAWVQSVRMDPGSPLMPKASLQPASLLDASGLLCEALQREGSRFLVFAPFPSLAPSRKAKLYYHGNVLLTVCSNCHLL